MIPLDNIIDQLTSLREDLRSKDRASDASLLQDLQLAHDLRTTINEILGCTPEQYTDLRNHDHLCIVVDLRKFMRLSTVAVPVDPGVNADGKPHAEQRDLSVAKTWADVAYVLDAAERQKRHEQKLRQLEEDKRQQAEEDAKKQADLEASQVQNPEAANQ
jgi:hypothetical protein